MAFWGAPSEDDNHAVMAIDAAMAMEQALLKFKQSLPTALTDFDIGIGIHTGECIVGMIGAKSRIDYTVIGDSVNLASRIEGLTKDNHRILVSERCKELAEQVYEFEFAGEYVVKGRKKQVRLYRPIKTWQQD
jgi:adenylate cyclase